MGQRNILVVDDDEANADIVKLILQSHGHLVDVAHGGKIAIDKAVQKRPDLVVLDVVMPDLNGFAVCRFIKDDAALQTTKVILLTSEDTEKNADRFTEAGADAYLEKPCDLDTLIFTVNKLLST